MYTLHKQFQHSVHPMGFKTMALKETINIFLWIWTAAFMTNTTRVISDSSMRIDQINSNKNTSEFFSTTYIYQGFEGQEYFMLFSKFSQPVKNQKYTYDFKNSFHLSRILIDFFNELFVIHPSIAVTKEPSIHTSILNSYRIQPNVNLRWKTDES